MKYFFSLLFCLYFFSTNAQQKNTSLCIEYFTDTSYDDVEQAYNYNFVPPVNADVLDIDPTTYVVDYNERFFMSTFGPRHKSTSTSNIGFFDFHKGTDITADVNYNGQSYDSSTPPAIQCMCNGIVDEIVDGSDIELEETGTGRYVVVKCNQHFNVTPDWGNIYIAYRHLESIDEGISLGQIISQEDPIGIMGASGHTTVVHLHMSVIRKNPGSSSSINVHPMRIFNPSERPHLMKKLEEIEINQLTYDSDSALFRIIMPYNQTSIRAIKVSLEGGSYERIYDYESISMLSEELRDDNDVLSGLEFFSYPFNRGHHAYRRVWDRYDDGQIPAIYPASKDAPSHSFFPFLSEGLLQTPANVLDMKVKDLPMGYDINDLKIEIIDIFGNGARTSGTSINGTFAWGMIEIEADDAEEMSDGTMSLTNGDLDMMYDGYNSDQQNAIGLRFSDINLPPNKTITSAKLQFRADASDTAPIQLTIHAENSSNSLPFSSSNGDITSRTITTASNTSDIPSWTIDDMGDAQAFTGLENVIQELCDRPDWTDSSPITLIVTGSDSSAREAEGHNDSLMWKNAYLYIEYKEIGTTDNPSYTCLCNPELCISCDDGTQNGDETGIDCGGTLCEPCCILNGDIFVDINATGTNNGSSWINAFTDLQDALAIGESQTIHIAEGIYLPTSGTSRGASFSIPNGSILLGGYPSGGGIRNADLHTTSLSGEIDGNIDLDKNSYHVVKVQNVTCITIDGLTIENGNADDANSFGRARGGGLYIIGSELTLSHVKVQGNAAIYGGGTFASLSPNVTILSSEYSNNTANNGSALYHSNETNMYILKSRIIDNNSLIRSAIEVNNSLYTKIENSVIANNASTNANAVALIATNRDQTFDVYNSTILGETKNKNLVTLQVGFGDQLDANFYNSIIAHQNLNFTRAFKDYNNGILNLHTENCYIQGSSVLGTAINNLYSDTSGDLLLNMDYSVNECSPTIDAGNDSFAADSIDINENNRVFGTVDIGAYEAQTTCLTFAKAYASVLVFPNPTSGLLNIQTLEEDISVFIYDMLGKRVAYTCEKDVNISDFSAGVYVLNVLDKNGQVIYFGKVMKE